MWHIRHGVAQGGIVWYGTARSNMTQPWHGTASVSSIACAQVVAVLPPAGHELPLCWVPVEDTTTVPGVTWKTLAVRPPCSGQGPTAQGEPLVAPAAPQGLGARAPWECVVGRVLGAQAGGC